MAKRIRLWRIFNRNRLSLVGLIIAVSMIMIAILAPFVAPHDPLEQSLRNRMKPPGAEFRLGTDLYGRDYLSRMIYGARISIFVGLVAVLLSMVIGTSWGMVAGFMSSKVETVLMRSVDVLMSFPTLIVGLIVMVVLGRGMFNLIVALAVVMFPRFARIAYSSTKSVASLDFILAARSLGMSSLRIIGKHILPNIFGDITVIGTMWLATAIRIEAALSFLGLGISPPTPTWGNMIRTGVEHLNLPWLAIFPGLAIFITVLGFNMIGDGLRDIVDPKLY